MYFLPTIIAILRKHNNTLPILLLNLFLGWTFLFWVIALVWSFVDNRNQEINIHNEAVGKIVQTKKRKK